MSRIVIGISGGVDSAVAALLLKQQGHEVLGVFMDNWDGADAYCTAAEDFQDARALCEALEVPLHKVSFADQYLERVFAGFLAELRAGRTPNPDVACNSEIKFRCFLDHALRLDAELLATGHYARVERTASGARLLRAADLDKDQTYFLHAIAPAALARAEFPLGRLTKPEVRALAQRHGLAVHDKPDSTGICFIGERRFREFLKRWLPTEPGPILALDGAPLGDHEGLAYYTLGQRAGLGIGGQRGGAELPWYVAGKDPGRNALLVVQGHDHPALLTSSVTVVDPRWSRATPEVGEPLTAQLRHRQAEQPCRIVAQDAARLTVRFDAPQRAATPGQYCVLYRGAECLGGGALVAPEAAAQAAVG